MAALFYILAFATVTTVVLSYLIIKLAVDDPSVRLFFSIIAALMPFVLIAALIRMLLRWRSDTIPCPEELATVEAEIERERVEKFGGKPLNPSLSAHWQAAYLNSVKKTAVKLDSVLGLLPKSTDHVFSGT